MFTECVICDWAFWSLLLCSRPAVSDTSPTTLHNKNYLQYVALHQLVIGHEDQDAMFF